MRLHFVLVVFILNCDLRTVTAEVCTENDDCVLTVCTSPNVELCQHPTGASLVTNGGLCTCQDSGVTGGVMHPTYSEMIAAALASLAERRGSSRQAILKYIMASYRVGNNSSSVNAHLKMALKSGLKNGSIKQTKGTGSSVSYMLGE